MNSLLLIIYTDTVLNKTEYYLHDGFPSSILSRTIMNSLVIPYTLCLIGNFRLWEEENDKKPSIFTSIFRNYSVTKKVFLKLLKISFVLLTSRRLIVMAPWQGRRSPDYIITSLRSLPHYPKFDPCKLFYGIQEGKTKTGKVVHIILRRRKRIKNNS